MNGSNQIKQLILNPILPVFSGIIWIVLLFQNWIYCNFLGISILCPIVSVRNAFTELKEKLIYDFEEVTSHIDLSDVIRAISQFEIISVIFVTLIAVVIILQFVYFSFLLSRKSNSKRFGLWVGAASIAISIIAIVGVWAINCYINKALAPINETLNDVISVVGSLFGVDGSVNLKIDANKIIMLTNIPYISIIPALIETFCSLWSE